MRFVHVLVALVFGLLVSASSVLASNPFVWTAPTDITPANLQGFLMGIVGPFYGPLMGLGLLTTVIWAVYRVIRGGIRKRA